MDILYLATAAARPVCGKEDAIQLCRKGFIAPVGDVFQGIADQMHDAPAPLDRHLGEDGLRALLQTRHAVHGQKQDVLHATLLYLVKNLHPVVLALRFVQPYTQLYLALPDAWYLCWI